MKQYISKFTGKFIGNIMTPEYKNFYDKTGINESDINKYFPKSDLEILNTPKKYYQIQTNKFGKGLQALGYLTTFTLPIIIGITPLLAVDYYNYILTDGGDFIDRVITTTASIIVGSMLYIGTNHMLKQIHFETQEFRYSVAQDEKTYEDMNYGLVIFGKHAVTGKTFRKIDMAKKYISRHKPNTK